MAKDTQVVTTTEKTPLPTETVAEPTLKLKKWQYVGGQSYLKFTHRDLLYKVENMTDEDVDAFVEVHENQSLFVKKGQ
jgi:hypothetical protein